MSSFTAYAFPFVLFLAFFALNNKSGELSLVKPLDFEAAVQYVLNVSASDMGEPRRRAFSNVTINVTDVNDNSPVLQTRIIQASVVEVSKFEAHLTLPWLQDYEPAFFGRKARNGEFIRIKRIIAFKIPAFNVFLCMKDAATVFWKTESISTVSPVIFIPAQYHSVVALFCCRVLPLVHLLLSVMHPTPTLQQMRGLLISL